MAINGGQIDYTVGFRVDDSGLKRLQQSVEKIRQLTTTDLININGAGLEDARSDLDRIRQTALQVQEALQKAYNVKLGTYNLEVFKKNLQILQNSDLTIQKMQKDFQMAGVAGQQAMLGVSQALTNVNLQAQKSGSIFDKMGATLKRTLTWSISSSVINTLSGSIQQAYGYVKNLDSSLNDIRIVTNKSADEMDRFAKNANKAAQTLGKSTTDYTNASLIYYQQGLSDEETAARTETTLKAASVTQQSTAAVSEQLTAVWNGYKVSAEEAELYVDKLAAVAADTAADLEELSTGMSKVASAANMVGVDVDQMNAILSTTISVTRQAPETVGTAYKTVLARMSTIAAGGTDEEDGATLTSYTEKMNEFGINVLDSNGKLRDMGDVIEEVGDKWGTFSREAQISLAQVMAGTRQYNNLVALFENWDMYTKAIETSANATGTLQKQQDIYMQSTEAHLQTMSTAAEGVFDSLLDTDDINTVVDGLTSVLNIVEDIVDTLGGGKEIIAWLLPQIMMLFSKDIGKGVSEQVGNLLVNAENEQKKREAQKAAKSEEFKGNDELVDTYMQGQEAILNSGASSEDIEKMQEQWNRNITLQSEMENLQKTPKQRLNELEQKSNKTKIVKDESGQIKRDSEGNAVIEEDIYSKINLKSNNAEDKLKELQKIRKDMEEVLKDQDISELMSFEQFDVILDEDFDKYADVYRKQIEVVRTYNEELATEMENNLKAREDYRNKEIEIEAQKNEAINNIHEEYNTKREEASSRIEQNKQEIETLRTTGKDDAIREKLEKKQKIEQRIAISQGQLDFASSEEDRQGYLNYIEELKQQLEEVNQEIENSDSALSERAAQRIQELEQQIRNEENFLENSEQEEQNAIDEQEDSASRQSDKNRENYEEQVEGLEDLEASAQESYKNILKTLDDADLAAEKKSEKLAEFYSSMTEQSQEFKQRGVENLVEGFTDIGTGAAAAVTSMTTLGQGLARIANSKDLSGPEKIAQGIGLIVSTATTAVNGIKNVSEGIKLLSNASKFFEQAQKIDAAITSVNTAAHTANVETQTAENVARTEGTIITGSQTTAENINTGAIIANTKAMAANALQWAKFHPILTALIAVIGLAIAGISAHTEATKQNIEATAENAKEQVELSQKIVDTTKQQKDNIDNLVNSYKELRDSIANNGGNLEELQQKTYNLCLEYEQQDLALQALISDYDQLNVLMKEAQTNANEENIKAEKEHTKNLEASAQAQIAQINADNHAMRTSWLDNKGQSFSTFQFDTGFGVSDREKEFVNKMAALMGKGGTLDFSELTGWGSMEIDVGELAENREEIQKIFNEYSDLTQHNVFKDFNDLVLGLSDAAGEYQDASDQLIKDAMENASLQTVDFNKIVDYKSFKEQADALKQELWSVYDENGMASKANLEDIEKYMMQFFGSSAETAKYLITDALVTAFKEATTIGEEELIKELEELNDSEKNFIYLHIKWIEDGETPQEFLDRFKTSQAYEQEQAVQSKTQNLFSKEEISEGDKQDLVDQSTGTELDFNKFLEENQQFSLSEFYEADIADTKAILNDYYTWQEQREEENKNQRLKTLEEQKKPIEDTLQKLQELQKTNALDSMKKTFEYRDKTEKNNIREAAVINNSELFGLDVSKFEEVEKDIQTALSNNDLSFFEAVLGKPEEELEDYEKKVKVVLETFGIDVNKIGERYVEQGEDIKVLNEELQYLSSTYIQLSDDTLNYSQIVANSKEVTKAQIESLSNLANVASTLKSAVSDFNEDGGFSIGTMEKLQQLQEINPEYLKALEKEGDHYVFNEQQLKKIFEDKKAELIIQQDNIIGKGKEELATRKLTIAELKREQIAAGTSEERRKQINQEIAGLQAELVIQEALINKDIESAEHFKELLEGMSYEGLEADTFEPDLDPYEDLTAAIDEVNDALSKLQEAQESLTGVALAQNFEEQNKLLKERRDLLNQMADSMEGNLSSQRSVLVGYGADFDEETDRLTNAGALKAQYSGDEESFNEINDLITKYIDTYSSYSDTLDQLLETSSSTAANETMENLALVNDSVEQASASLAIVQEEYEKYKELVKDDDLTSEEQKEALAQYSEGLQKEADAYKELAEEADAAVDSIIALTAAQTNGELQFGRNTAQNNASYQKYLNDLSLRYQSGEISEETYNTSKAVAEANKEAIDEANESLEETEKTLREINDELTVTKEEAHDAFAEFRYGTQDLQMQKLSKDLSLLQRQASKLEGPELINNLKKQQSIIQKQITVQKTKLALQKLELANERQLLLGKIQELKLDTLSVQLQFDKEGNIANISEFSKALEENAEKLGLNEEQVRQLIERLKAYQSVLSEITGTQNEIDQLGFDIEDIGDNIKEEAEKAAKEAKEKIKEEMSKALEIFNAKVDIEVNIEDAWRQFNELEKRVQGLKDFDIFGNALLDYKNALTFLTANPNSYFGDAGGGSIEILTKHVNDIMGEIGTMQAGGTSSLYGKDQSAAFGDLENYYNQLMSQVNAFYDKLDEVKQAYGQMIDEVISKNDELISDISTIGSLLDHGANLTKLLYGDDSYAELKEYYQQSAENSKELLDESVRRKDYYKELLATINPEKNPDEYEKVKSAYISAMDDIYKYGEELIKKFQDELANAVKASNKQAREDLASLAGFSSPEMQDQDWEIWQYNDDKYLDPTNTEYEMTTLANKFNDAINDTDSLNAKEKLRDVMQEQLDILQQQLDEGQKLTQYDIDRANKIYELTLRQIALEEAQQNKSKTRLRRDSQGNYRYEFVSDDDAVQDATQDLLDAQNDLYNFDKEHTIELQNEVMERYQEYAAKVEEIANNHNLSEEQRQEMLAVLYEQYYGDEGILTGLAAEYEDTRHNLSTDTDNEITISNDTMTDSIVQNWNDIAANEQERIGEMIDAVHEEQEQISEANAIIAEGYGNIDEAIDNNIGSMEELIAVDETLLEGYEEELDAIEDLLASLEALEAQYKSVMDAALAAVDAALKLRQTSWDNGEDEDTKSENQNNQNTGAGNNLPEGTNNLPTNNDKKREKKYSYTIVTDGSAWYIVGKTSNSTLMKVQNKAQVPISGNVEGLPGSNKFKVYGTGEEFTIKKPGRSIRWTESFDTGGYTGEWGPEGRVAMLHQKELVLNKDDTSNMLQMVKVVRGFDNITNKISDSLDKMVMKVLSTIYKHQINSSEQFNKLDTTTDLNQDVKIEANFPSVKSASEIEEALNNLVNLASQKALKQRR